MPSNHTTLESCFIKADIEWGAGFEPIVAPYYGLTLPWMSSVRDYWVVVSFRFLVP